MGQVYIAVVAIMFLIIIKWVSMQMRLDKHIRTGILRGSVCLVQRSGRLRQSLRCGQHVTNTWFDLWAI
jgi:hypothetical protein